MIACKLTVILYLVACVSSQTVRQSMSAIEELEEYIEQKKPEINQRYRLHYHVAGPVGWINDPNGFSFYKGEYHLFYQFYPYDSIWGPMHWGHVKSQDLVTWTQLPTALIPEEEYCFSGSAVVDGDELVLMYTGHLRLDTPPYHNETQYIASSNDGVVFTKFEGNPVIASHPDGLPDFRDPKTWKHEDHWYTVIGSKTLDDIGTVLLYRSEDLINWDYLGLVGENDGSLGYMWECPDFFELDGKYVLLISPQGLEPVGDRYKNIHQNGYIIGSFNYTTFEFIAEVGFQEIDYGHDFYAAQTTDDANGRRYITAWFDSWDVYRPEQADGWSGALTIIRELTLSGDRILMKPVDAMISLRDLLVINGDFEPYQHVDFDQTAEIIIEGNLNQGIDLLIRGRDGGDPARLRFNPEDRKVSLDRRNGDIRQVEWYPIGSLSWRIFLDASSVELFLGEGEVVFSSRLHPDGGWRVTNLSPQVLSIEAYTLKRSVPYYSSATESRRSEFLFCGYFFIMIVKLFIESKSKLL